MKRTRALTLLLAVAMVIPQFAMSASAANEYNLVKIEEEVLVENGTFDEMPVIKNDQTRAYHNQTPGTWAYQHNTSGTASVEYDKDGDNGYLKVTAANVNPSVAYAFGEVKKGDYKLTLDVYPEQNSTVNRMIVQVFYNLDSSFNVGNTAYRLITKDFTLTKGTYNTLSVDVSLAQDTKLAFRVYSQPDNPADGSFRIDNLSLGRPADVLVETADLDAVDTSKAYTGVSDTTLPEGKWAATDNTYLKLDNSGSYIAAKKNDSDIPNTPSIIYTFPETVGAGKYRLTFDVLTSEARNGNCQVANVTSTWTAYTVSDANVSNVTGGKRYSMVFNVAADNTLVAFRYYQNTNVVPSKPFSIDNVKLEMFDTGATYWEVVESNDFTTAPGMAKLGGSWTPGTAGTWGIKGSSANSTVAHSNGKLLFNNDNEQAGVAYRFPANLSEGKYRLNFTLTYDTTSQVNTRLCVFKNGTGTNVLDTSFKVTGSLAVSKEFDNTDATGTYYFRMYPNQTTNQPTVYTIDDYSLERSVSGKWVVKYDSETAAAPGVKNDAGINYNNCKNFKNTWCVRENNNAIAAVSLDYTNGKLNATARTTAIYGKPTVMYGFNTAFAKGSYSVDVAIKNLATVGSGDNYEVALYDKAGTLVASNSVTVGANTNAVTVPISFTLDSDADLVLSVKSAYESTNFTSAFEIQSVTVTKTGNPLVQLRSNADLAVFDADDGVYYMAVNAANDVYFNYFADKEFRPGVYKLTAELRTDDPNGAELAAAFGYLPLDTYTLEAGEEWQTVEYDVTLKYATELTATRGIRFDVDSTAPLYLKDLKLVYVDKLPTPALNSAIAMILLKKIEGTYPSYLDMIPRERVVNGDFDKEATFTHDQSRNYYNQQDGTWSYSMNSGSVNASVHKDGYAYFDVANANPSVGYRIGTLPEGKYTLTFDVHPEYSIGNIRTRIFRLDEGFAVGKAEFVLIDKTSPLTVGQNNTLTFEFTLTEETAVAFNFYATKENPCPEKGSFRIDNVSVIG